MRLIDADELNDQFCEIVGEYNVMEIHKIINNAPVIVKCDKTSNGLPLMDLRPRPQGEWIKWNFKDLGSFYDWEYKCSNCKKVYGGRYNYCPNCGAEMRGGE